MAGDASAAAATSRVTALVTLIADWVGASDGQLPRPEPIGSHLREDGRADYKFASTTTSAADISLARPVETTHVTNTPQITLDSS